MEARRNKRMYPKTSVKRCACMCGTSLFVLIFGIVVICVRTVLYNAIVSKMFTLGPNSPTYDMWVKNPVPLTLRLHLFNWTNPKDIYNGTIKPIFKDLGPYTYDETKEKVNITWNANGTVSYYNLKKWWFNPSKSNGSLSDPVTSVSPIALSTAAMAKDWSFFLKSGLNFFLSTYSSNTIHSTHAAGDILFEGYSDPLLTMANKLPSLSGNSMPNFDKFGWFYTRNGSETYEGQFNMDQGISGQLGELHSWKFYNYTPYYPEECGRVTGSAGDMFPGDLKKDSVVKFFSADLCRFVELEFEKETVVNGILGYKYVASDRFLDNGTKIPANKCFCNEKCAPYGALDVSACRYGSPAYVSLPHFHRADPYFTGAIEGVKSDKDAHEFFMIFEPRTGIPLQVAARLQLNLLMQPVPGVRFIANVPKLFIPILWFEQTVLIPEEITFYLALLINLEVICLAVGIAIIFLAILLKACCCYKLCRTNILRKEQVIITREEMPLQPKKNKTVQVKFAKDFI